MGFEPVPTASKPCCPTQCVMGTVGMQFLTNVSEILKIFGTTGTRTRTYRFRTMLSYPLCHGNHWNAISNKCQWNHKHIWHDRDSNPDLLFENPVVLTPLLSFIFEEVGNFELKKKLKRPYWMNNFCCILHMRRKINFTCNCPAKSQYSNPHIQLRRSENFHRQNLFDSTILFFLLRGHFVNNAIQNGKHIVIKFPAVYRSNVTCKFFSTQATSGRTSHLRLSGDNKAAISAGVASTLPATCIYLHLSKKWTTKANRVKPIP